MNTSAKTRQIVETGLLSLAVRSALTAAGPGDHHLGRVVACYGSGGQPMIKNIVVGCTIVSLMFMVLLAFAQEHHECWNGHLVKIFKPCGSLSPSM
ncbi:hypothetical protein [Bradyrhizobium sp. STM 3562]|uniref:hypothetical protein n=1 Tax=Bradyrhizobium sp. STM 3562 TaxID=578924 RepID=UPI00388CF63D